MATGAEFPSMGATIFFGLTAAALITQAPEQKFANPYDRLEGSGFERAAALDFAGFMAWSYPIQIPDPALAGTSGPENRPYTGPNPREYALRSVVTVPITAMTAATAVQPVPVDAAAQFEVSSLAGLDSQLGLSGPAEVAPDQGPSGVPTNSPAKPLIITHAGGPAIDTTPGEIQHTDVAALQPGLSGAAQRYHATLAALSSDPGSPNPRVAIPAQVNGNAVNLRVAPNRDAEPVAQYDSGAQGLIVEIEGDWRLIAFDDVTGWMFNAYLEPLAQ